MSKKPSPLPSQASLFSQRETPDAFRKAVQVLHSKPFSPIHLVQRKLLNAWIKNSFENEPDDKGWWQIRTPELAANIGFDSNNREYLRDACRSLMNLVFEWDILATSTKRVDWKASVLFPEVEITNDKVRYQISPHIRESMIKPEIYAMIDMNIVRRFRRAPALAIWEFCIRFEKIYQTPETDWPKFRDMILGENNQNKTYEEYKYFKSKILKPCINEINDETDHTIQLIESKAGRSVTSIKFTVRRKTHVLDVAEDDRSLEFIGEMVKLGVPQSEAKKMTKSFNASDIKAAIDYTRKRVNNKATAKLANPAAYFRQALTNNYAGVLQETQPPQADLKPEVDIRSAYLLEQQKLASHYFQELDAVDQQAKIDEYNGLQELSFLRITKRSSKTAEATFLKWLATKTWGDPSAEALLEFAQKLLSNKK